MCVYCLHPFQSNGEKVKDKFIKFQAFLSQHNISLNRNFLIKTIQTMKQLFFFSYEIKILTFGCIFLKKVVKMVFYMSRDWEFSICHTYKSSQSVPADSGQSGLLNWRAPGRPSSPHLSCSSAAVGASGFKILTEKSEVKNGELDCRIWRIFQVIFEEKQHKIIRLACHFPFRWSFTFVRLSWTISRSFGNLKSAKEHWGVAK